MEYKRFVASTCEEARKEVFRDLGVNAYIIKQNDIVKSRFFGLVKKKFVEIYATKKTHDSPSLKASKRNKLPISPKHARTTKGLSESFFESEIPQKSTKMKQLAETFINQKYLEHRDETFRALRERRKKKDSLSYLNGYDLHVANSHVEGMQTWDSQTKSSPLHHSKHLTEKKEETSLSDASSEATPSNPINPINSIVYEFLIEKDFSNSFASLISRKCKELDVKTEEQKQKIAKIISTCFSYAGDIKIYYSNPNLLFFVGPTGVGKTTTIPKIASHFIFREHKEVVMATFDIRRIMATAQLEAYAKILSVPFRVLREKSDFRDLVKEFISKNLIFIDTAGTSQNDTKHIDEIADYITSLQYPRDVYLCLNASFRYKDLLSIMGPFRKTEFNKLLITKSDESHSLGSVLSVAYESKIPLSFITNGQEVPHDVHLLNEETLEKFLMKEWI